MTPKFLIFCCVSCVVLHSTSIAVGTPVERLSDHVTIVHSPFYDAVFRVCKMGPEDQKLVLSFRPPSDPELAKCYATHIYQYLGLTKDDKTLDHDRIDQQFKYYGFDLQAARDLANLHIENDAAELAEKTFYILQNHGDAVRKTFFDYAQ